MEQQLKAALLWDPLLDSSRVHVAVIHRVAYLSGMVDSDLQKADAQDVAARTKGVVLVHNYLKIEPTFSSHYYAWPHDNQSPYYVAEIDGPQPTWLSDEQIKKNIEDAFFWSPFVDRDDITVTVRSGVATLTGTVGSWIGYGEADKDAHKSGATDVLNRVKVKKGMWLW
jgi:osmotically-inducible protein OsmY